MLPFKHSGRRKGFNTMVGITFSNPNIAIVASHFFPLLYITVLCMNNRLRYATVINAYPPHLLDCCQQRIASILAFFFDFFNSKTLIYPKKLQTRHLFIYGKPFYLWVCTTVIKTVHCLLLSIIPFFSLVLSGYFVSKVQTILPSSLAVK